MDSNDKFTPAEKAVATLVAIGKPGATQLLNQMTRDEISSLMATSRKMKAISQTGLEKIAHEFELEFTMGAGLIDSSAQMEAILGASFDEAELASLKADRKTVNALQEPKPSVWDVLADVQAPAMARYLEVENEQVGAIVLTRLKSGQAAEIISEIDPGVRLQLLSRMLSLNEPSAEAQALIEEELLEQFGKSSNPKGKNGLSNVASILNEMEKVQTEDILMHLSQSAEPASLSAVRSMLYRFEDIGNLEPSARAIIFDSMKTETITMALRNAPPELVESVLSSISQRTRRMVEGDLKTKVQIRATDISAARKIIVNEVLRKAGEGLIAIAPADAESA